MDGDRKISALRGSRVGGERDHLNDFLRSSLWRTRKKQPPVALDAEQIKQVLLNLALNAIQAMPDGGTLTFSTKFNENQIIIKIDDTGKGIDEKNLRRIFDPFFQPKKKVSV